MDKLTGYNESLKLECSWDGEPMGSTKASTYDESSQTLIDLLDRD